MTLQRQIDDLTTYRASEWLEALKSGGERERIAFVEWLAESPRHVSEVLSLVALGHEVRALDLKGQFELKALLAEASAPVAELRPVPDAQAQVAVGSKRARARKWLAGVAAAVVIAVAGSLYMRGDLWTGQHYVTAVGEQRSIELIDGSVVYLNSQSDLRVRFGQGSRDINLEHGEALFKVAHDPARPFRVRTRDVVVQAVGTEFNVYERTASTTVSVIEGKVRIDVGNGQAAPGEAPTTAALGAGEEMDVAATGKVDRRAHADLARAIAWRQRRVVFEETSLEDVVAEFNRYNQSPKLRLDGIAPGSRHYSGDFEANDPESLAALLSREQDLSVERRDGEIVIRGK